MSEDRSKNAECAGCAWLRAEIERRRDLERQFSCAGDSEMMRLVSEGIDALYEDWRGHMNRDHASLDRGN